MKKLTGPFNIPVMSFQKQGKVYWEVKPVRNQNWKLFVN